MSGSMTPVTKFMYPSKTYNRSGCYKTQTPLLPRPKTSVDINRVLPDVIGKGDIALEKNRSRLSNYFNCQHGSESDTPSEAKPFSSISKIRQQLEENMSAASSVSMEDQISPGLAKLRMTPAGVMKEKRKQLIKDHEDIRQRNDMSKSCGGVTLWPEMNQMRLTKSEIFQLVVQALLLCLSTLFFLNKVHGKTFGDLSNFTHMVKAFEKSHKIIEINDQKVFQAEVIAWHQSFLNLTSNIQEQFDMTSMDAASQIYMFSYLGGLSILVYFLIDNMFSKHKLTPSRIKKWASLLTVIGTWTVVMGYGLVLAFSLERAIVRCVQKYASFLGILVTIPLDLSLFQSVLLYWRSRCLDHTSHGLLSVFGLVSVTDLIYYIQYYSFPIITVLISPVIKVCYSCWTVYCQGVHIKAT